MMIYIYTIFLLNSCGFFTTFSHVIYVSIKPIEEKCIRIQKTECDSKEIEFKLIHTDILYDIIKFTRSQDITSYKQAKGLLKLLDFNKNDVVKIIQSDNRPEPVLFDIFEIILTYIDDIFHIYDIEKKTKLSIRTRYYYYSQTTEIMIVSIYITVKLNNPDIDSLSDDENIEHYKKYYSLRTDKPHSKYEYAAERVYYCIPDNTEVCIRKVNESFPIKDNTGNTLTFPNNIYKNYYLEFIIKKYHETLNIKYKFKGYNIFETNNYEDNDIQCNINCNGNNKCYFEKIGETQYPKCSCGEYYYGINCQYKYNCQNCEENKCKTNNKCDKCINGYFGQNCEKRLCHSLKMCGLYGECSENISDNECICKPNWNGKYCTKNLSSLNTTVTIIHLNQTLNENKTTKSNNINTDVQTNEKDSTDKLNNRASNVKIAVGVTIGLIITIIIIAGFIVYLLKRNS